MTSPLRVLLVDDDRVSQRYAAAVLKHLGLEVDIANNGVEAIAALSRVDYVLVLMDCLMPEMDGLEATKRIRSGATNVLNPSIPIIGYTAHVLAENMEACKSCGMNDCLTKPVPIEKLIATVKKWLPARASHI